jgi:hypothetical protein
LAYLNLKFTQRYQSIMQKTGQEPFTFNETNLDMPLLQFWQWSQSNLLTNTLRGHLAEFIVASALGLSETVRVEWDAFDLVTDSGVKVEVKSAAYLQGWDQKRDSSISFSIRPTRAWESATNSRHTDKKRQADVYVFCLLHHRNANSVNPLALEQWTFYVLPTSILDQAVAVQKNIALASLLRLDPTVCQYTELARAIKNCVAK